MKYKYLIVEDQLDSIQLLISRLKRYKNRLEPLGIARTGHEAVDMIQKLDPDLVFMDIALPNYDGFEVLKAFEKPRFQVIFASGFDGRGNLKRAVKTSALDFISKPFTPDEIDEAVQRFLDLADKDSSLRIEHFLKFKSQRELDRIVLPLFKTYKVVLFDEIVHIEARRGSYVIFCATDGNQYIATKSMRYYEDLLPTSIFFRSHKSHVINLFMIDSVDTGNGGMVYMKDGSTIPVAFRRKAELLRALKAATGLSPESHEEPEN